MNFGSTNLPAEQGFAMLGDLLSVVGNAKAAKERLDQLAAATEEARSAISEANQLQAEHEKAKAEHEKAMRVEREQHDQEIAQARSKFQSETAERERVLRRHELEAEALRSEAQK